MADSHFTYIPIDRTTDTIRVLLLRRGYDTDPIECELVETLAGEEDGIPYEALSYTWGDSSITVDITLCGRKKAIKDNLYNALHCLRKADQDRWLWVDSICIDQENHGEKTHQVGYMRRIYERAGRVIIWLGRRTDDIDLLMDLMTQLGKRVRRNASHPKDDLKAWAEEWQALASDLGGFHTDLNKRRRDGLLDMLSRPWFQRVWILQEVFRAKRATVMCGWHTVPTEMFVVMPCLMQVQPDAHVQSVLDIMPGYLRNSSWRSEAPNLVTLLKRFHASKATDSRDKIYALLGIASDTGSDSGFQPDYAIDVEEAVQNAVSHILFGVYPASSLCTLPTWSFSTFIQNLDKLPSTILGWAFETDNSRTAEVVLSRTGIDVNGAHTPHGALQFLAQEGKYSAETIDAVLNHPGVDVNVQDSESPRNSFNGSGTLLELAAAGGHTKIVELLLKRGANVEARNLKTRVTPLMLAAAGGHTEVAELLLKRGANVEARNLKTGVTPLMLAAAGGHEHVVGALLKASADPDATGDYQGLPPEKENEQIVNTVPGTVGLDQNGLEYDATGPGATALWVAALRGHTAIVESLANAGADITSRGQRLLCSPLRISLRHHRYSTARFLIERSVRLGMQDIARADILADLKPTLTRKGEDHVQLLIHTGMTKKQAKTEILAKIRRLQRPRIAMPRPYRLLLPRPPIELGVGRGSELE